VREIGLSISTVRSGKIAEQAVQAAITVRMFALPPRGRTLRYLLGAVSPIAPYLSAISLQENHFHFHVGVAGLGLTVLPTRISLRNAGLQNGTRVHSGPEQRVISVPARGPLVSGWAPFFAARFTALLDLRSTHPRLRERATDVCRAQEDHIQPHGFGWSW
jgi:hypothetical protein